MQPILINDYAMSLPPGSTKHEEFIIVTDGTVRGVELAKKLGVKTAFATDLICDPVAAEKHGKMPAKLKQKH